MAENVNLLYEGNYSFEEVEVIGGQDEIRFSLTAFLNGQWEVSSSLYYVVDSQVLPNQNAIDSYLASQNLTPVDGNYQTGDGGYQTDDGGYQSDDGGYQTDDGGYQTDDGGHESDDVGYQSGDVGYQTDDGGYHPGEDDGGYQSDDGGYSSGDGGYQTDDGGYQSDDGGYQTDDGGYQTDDGGHESDDGGYQSGDVGYQTDDGGYHPGEDDGVYQSDDGGYHPEDDGVYQSDDGGYQTVDGGYQPGEDDGVYQSDDGGYHPGEDDGVYQSDDVGYQTDDGGYSSGDVGYQSDDGVYQSDDGGYQTDDGGYQPGENDGGYQTDDGGYQTDDGGYQTDDGETDGEDEDATIDLSEPVGVLDLADQEEVTDFASDFGRIWFQFYDKDESGDFGPGDPWTISIEDGEEDALEEVTVDMDGFVFAGDFEAYWQQVFDISSDEEDWHETEYAPSSEGIDNLYEDYPFLQDWSVDETEEIEPGFADGEDDEHEGVESGPADGEGDKTEEVESGPTDDEGDETEGENEFESDSADGEDDEHHLAIVKTTDFDLLDDGLVRLSGSLLYDGDDSDTETGFVISDSLLLGDDEFESDDSDGEEHGREDEVRVIAIDDNDDGEISFEFEPSLSGATYYYRAYAINEAGVSYGAPENSYPNTSMILRTTKRPMIQSKEKIWRTTTRGPKPRLWRVVGWMFFGLEPYLLSTTAIGSFTMVSVGCTQRPMAKVEFGFGKRNVDGCGPSPDYGHTCTVTTTSEWIYFLANREGRAYFYNYSTNSAE